MQFTVLEHGSRPRGGTSCGFLLTDHWDDWFRFETMYFLVIADGEGEHHDIGELKIGQFDMTEGQRRADVPTQFEVLDDRCFSLGQDRSYYENLTGLGSDIRDAVLRALRDVALDGALFQRALGETVTKVSLLRSVPPATVSGQLSRLARGGARLSRYEFNFTAPRPASTVRTTPPIFSFMVRPESQPPTNIHVLIGRNGVGKTYLLNHMARALVMDADDAGEFMLESEHPTDQGIFANLVSVSFSAFDTFEPLPDQKDRSRGVQYAYIGLKRVGQSDEGKPLAPKSPKRLSIEFATSMAVCRQGARVSRWRRALEILEADPIFRDADITSIAAHDREERDLKSHASRVFRDLSSGHKIVLLTMTRLVETVEERTLVLLDEPEAHLHPPLLSAFVRALSDLLTNRNGVAIIATHSPVVLQEVPRSCAWKIRRNGAHVVAERPEIETFGENVGILTREVFGLEVTHAGFHKLLADAVAELRDFDEVIDRFGGELGGEAKAIIRVLTAPR